MRDKSLALAVKKGRLLLQLSCLMTRRARNLNSGNPFVNQEMVGQSLRHVAVRFSEQALGVGFNWTLKQEALFSTALTGKPLRKEAFNACKWDRCAVGFQENSAPATQHQAWITALHQGTLWDLKTRSNDALIFAPAYLEAFWGYIWPAVCHHYVPMVGK